MASSIIPPSQATGRQRGDASRPVVGYSNGTNNTSSAIGIEWIHKVAQAAATAPGSSASGREARAYRA